MKAQVPYIVVFQRNNQFINISKIVHFVSPPNLFELCQVSSNLNRSTKYVYKQLLINKTKDITLIKATCPYHLVLFFYFDTKFIQHTVLLYMNSLLLRGSEQCN